MCLYTFWPNANVKGLEEKLSVIADTYQEALTAAQKHVSREISRKNCNLDKCGVEACVVCNQCGKVYKELYELDTLGNKNLEDKELLSSALEKDNRYRRFKRLHSHHHFDAFGHVKADGLLFQYFKG